MEHKKANIDVLLHCALQSDEKPDMALVEMVKAGERREEPIMKTRSIKRSFTMALVAAAVVICLATSAMAAWYFLSPSEVALELGNPALAEAFQSEDAVLINKTQSQNGYDISLLGIVSGNGLEELDGAVDKNKSYAVVAIGKSNGGAMPDTSSDDYDSTPFFVSPLIRGQKPWQYNIASMGGGYSSYVVDGVMYRMIECGSLEQFADRGLSLIVSSTVFYDINAYDYDEATGLVTPNPDYDGINIVFDLPLDTKNADYEKAQKYLDSLWDDAGDDGTDDSAADASEADAFIEIT